MRALSMMFVGFGIGQVLSAALITRDIRTTIGACLLLIGFPMYLYARHKSDRATFAELRSILGARAPKES